MTDCVTLAYLGGIFDGDGSFKITRKYRTPRIRHPYYANVLGLAQLWPREVVRVFASAFGSEVKPVRTTHGTLMARCELRTCRVEWATRRLLPFLLVKRRQAMLFLEVPRVRPRRKGRTVPTETGQVKLEQITEALGRDQEGRGPARETCQLCSPEMKGYENINLAQRLWNPEGTLAYLAGIMDSDENFRIERKRVPGMLSPSYRINMCCAQVDPSPAVELLARTFGGQTRTVQEKKLKSRDLSTWSIYDRTAATAIERTLPFLQLKWIDACLLLELRHLKSLGKNDLTEWVHRNRWQFLCKVRKRAYSAEQVRVFENVRQRLLALHEGKRRAAATVPEALG